MAIAILIRQLQQTNKQTTGHHNKLKEQTIVPSLHVSVCVCVCVPVKFYCPWEEFRMHNCTPHRRKRRHSHTTVCHHQLKKARLLALHTLSINEDGTLACLHACKSFPAVNERTHDRNNMISLVCVAGGRQVDVAAVL